MRLNQLLRYWHTLRFLRASQILWRLWYRLYHPLVDANPAPPTRVVQAQWSRLIQRRPSVLDPDHVRFLNVEARLGDPSIWNDTNFTKLWLYNLHYFDDLNAQDAEMRVDWHRTLITQWIRENPPARGTGWEPYPTSLRLVNWVKWILAGNTPNGEMRQSMAVQARWLCKHLEYHILGNHLLANAKALCFIGCYFAEEEGSTWYDLGMNILQQQIPEQILPDGGHFELSPMYHLIILEDLLDIIQLHQVYSNPVPDYLVDATMRMLYWAGVMQHPDGEIPFFNDAAFEIAARPGDLDSYAAYLGYQYATKPIDSLVHLRDSGYVRLTNQQATAFVDIAAVGPDYLPGHAHADTLSFELSLAGRRVIVNGGTSVYGSGLERKRQRSTAAHSTVMIDGQDSSEVWGGFRVARRAKILYADSGKETHSSWALGKHDGYQRLPGAPIHRRRWQLTSEAMRVADTVTGRDFHTIEILFLLGSKLKPTLKADNIIYVIDTDTEKFVFLVQVTSNTEVVLEETRWNPRFGETLNTWRIRVKLSGMLPLQHESAIIWAEP